MLGEELKKLREERGLSLSQISDSTRIGTRFLRAIETNDFATLPEGIYTRSFIRAYAKQVGMDEEEALKLYSEQTGAAERLSDPTEVASQEDTFVYKEPSSSLLPAAVVALALALALITGSWALWRYMNSPAEPEEVAVAPEPPPTEAPVEPAPAPAPVSFEQGLHVTLEATNADCWIRYTADDGEPTQMTLAQGQQERIEAKGSIDLSIGNTRALAIRINDRDAHFPEGTGVVLPKLTITPESAKALVEPQASGTVQ
jgi:cytoskeletal protein RodZ